MAMHDSALHTQQQPANIFNAINIQKHDRKIIIFTGLKVA